MPELDSFHFIPFLFLIPYDSKSAIFEKFLGKAPCHLQELKRHFK